MAAETKPTSNGTTSPKKTPTENGTDSTTALEHFAQGKRHLLVNDVNAAVNSLQEACRLLAEQYGETAPECGDAYYYYGKALLELARIENGVLGNALDGVPEGEDLENSQVENPEKMTEEEYEMVCEKVDEALEENLKETEKSDTKEDGEKMETDDKSADKSKSDDSSKTENGETKSEADKTKTKSTDAKDESKTESSDTKDESKAESSKATEESSKATEESKKESSKATEESKKESETKSETKSEDKETSKSKSEEKINDSDDKEKENGEKTENESGEASENEEDAEENGGEEGESPEANGEASQEEGEKPEDDDVTTLQLSWEMLELAKMIYKKQDDKPDMKLKIAQVYLKLGEVGLESENYSQSIEDFKECYTIEEDILKADDRCLAETHYQLGIAYSFSDDFDNAIGCFKSAVNVVETRITNLKNTMKEKENWTEEQKKKHTEENKEALDAEEKEIAELNLLLPEMKEKVTDMEQMKSDSKEKLVKLAKESASLASTIGGSASNGQSNGASTSSESFGSSSFTSTSTSAKPVSNISHLIKKKRKPEEEEDSPAAEPKKAKGENGEALPSPKEKSSAEAKNGKSSPEKKNGTDDKKSESESDKMETDSTPTAEELKKKIAEEKKTEEVKA